MAISSDCLVRFGTITIPQAHIVLGGYQELDKGTLVINTLVYRTKEDYLANLPAVDHLRHVAPVSELSSGGNFRTGIYTWLMQQPEFVNPVADMDDNFPVTPIE